MIKTFLPIAQASPPQTPNVLFCPLAQDENHTGARLQLPHRHMLKTEGHSPNAKSWVEQSR